jgi:hypothetical protein
MPRVAVLIAVLAFGLVGCATPDTAEPAGTPSGTGSTPSAKRILTVPQAIHAGDQPVKVRGYVLIGADGVTRLCTGLAGSYPPQCGSPSLQVKGELPDDLPGRESAQGVTWTGETTLRGTLAGGVLTLS